MPRLSLGPVAPFIARPSPVCLCGCVFGVVEDDAVVLGLVLGLVLEEEEEERGLFVPLEVLLVSPGFVPLVVVGEFLAVGRVVLVVGLLAFEGLEGVVVPLVFVGVRARLAVVGVSLAVGRVVLVAGLLVFKTLTGVLVPRVLVGLGEIFVRGFLALVFTAVALVVLLWARKRDRIVWSALALSSAAFCLSSFRAAPPRFPVRRSCPPPIRGRSVCHPFLCLVPPGIVGRSLPRVPAAVSPFVGGVWPPLLIGCAWHSRCPSPSQRTGRVAYCPTPTPGPPSVPCPGVSAGRPQRQVPPRPVFKAGLSQTFPQRPHVSQVLQGLASSPPPGPPGDSRVPTKVRDLSQNGSLSLFFFCRAWEACEAPRPHGPPPPVVRSLSLSLSLSPGLWRRGFTPYTARLCAPDSCGGQKVARSQRLPSATALRSIDKHIKKVHDEVPETKSSNKEEGHQKWALCKPRKASGER